MTWDYSSIGLLIVGIIVAILLIWLFIKPVKFILKILANSVAGVFFLILFNYAGSLWNIQIGVNAFTALICGILGFPGFLLLLAVKFFYGA